MRIYGDEPQGHLRRVIPITLLPLMRALGLLRWLSCYRYVMAPTLINMIGRKP